MRSETLLSLRILTPEGAIFETENLSSVTVPLVDGGSIGIRPGHAPLIAETAQGNIRYQTESENKVIELHPGVLEINNNIIIILTAGQVSQTPGFLTKVAVTEFDRLMQTLVMAISPDTKFEKEQEING